MADNVLRVLIVEESSNEAEAVINALRNAGHAVRAQRVEDDEDFEAALDQQQWDLAVCPPKLTFFEAAKAAELIGASQKDIPLLIVKPRDAELTVAQALRLGAVDCVNNDDPEHLQYVVQRELSALVERRQHRVCKKAMRESERRCRTLLDSSRDAITYVHEGMHIYANPVYLEMFGYAEQDEIESMPILDMVAPEDLDKFKKFLRGFSKSGENLKGEIEVRGLRADNSEFKAVMEFTPATIEGEACTQIIIRSQANKELEKQLNFLSKQDLLTGLFNRQYLIEKLDEAISDATEQSNSALLYIELDKFGDIKENVGIAGVDLVLGDVAKVLKAVVPPSDVLARFSDHTFAALVANPSRDKVKQLAESMKEKLAGHICNAGEQSVTTTCSIGVAVVSESTRNAQSALDNAANACAVVRDGGGNAVHVHNPIADRKAGEEQNSHWASIIQDAIKQNQFFNVYLPVVSLHGDPEELYEVLIRLRGTEGRTVMPGEFMGAAQQAGLMKHIDRWVLHNSVRTLAERRDQGHDTRFFVKLSTDSLRDETTLPWLSELLKKFRVSGDSLSIELSESGAISYLKQAKAFISGLKQLRCSSVLDHFGTDAASVANLKHLDVDFLKIDGELVKNVTSDVEKQDAVKELAQLAQSIEKKTIAEFVQDANSLAVLWQCGVNYIQGYFLQEPSEELNYDFAGDED